MPDRRQEDRRQMDRRESEQGTIKIKKQNLIAYLITIVLIAIIVIIAVFLSEKIEKNKALSRIEQRHSNKYSCKLSFEGDKTKGTRGDLLIFEIKASNIQAEEGIIMLEGLLEYDNNALECFVDELVSGTWHKASMLEGYLTMARNDLMPSSEDQSIGLIVVKVKDQARKGSYEIKLKDPIFTMEDNKDFAIDDVGVTIDIV